MKNCTLNGLILCFFLAFSNLAQAQAPVADFESCTRLIEQYETVQLFDKSTNSPYQWTWDVYDSFTNSWVMSLSSGDVYSDPWSTGNTEFTQNPEFAFDQIGCYTIVLTAKNASGQSVARKKCYIKVISITSYYLGYGTYGPLGDNHVYSDYGKIFDDGGEFLKYSNNQNIGTKSHVLITPSNMQKITIDFKQLRFADIGDTLRIYDANQINPSKLLAALTFANNGQYPTFTTSGSAMYVYFKSDASGIDSGYHAEYYTESGKPYKPNLAYTHNNVSMNFPISFISTFRGLHKFSYDINWILDNAVQPQFNNKDTFVYTAKDLATHKLCIEAKNCDSTISYCANFNANTSIQSFTNSINSISVYPNPFHNILQIQNNLDVSINKINFYTIYGQEIEIKLVEKDGAYELHPIVPLASGMYVITVEYADGRIANISVLKN